MRAGKLRHRVTFQTRTAGEDAAGQPVKVWTDALTRWCNITAPSGAETVDAAATRNRVDYIISTRYTTRITPDMRAVRDDVVYSILAVRDPDGMRREILIECTTGMKTNE
jgi:SPP1 family predicted phage head-tail adaptor